MNLPLINTQPIERGDYQEDGSLDVISVWPTIQGEGPFAGRPAVFVRLAGCSLLCPACDTDYTKNRERRTIDSLICQIDHVADAKTLVVLTGGEPFRQNVMPLIDALTGPNFGLTVQVETNGTLYVNDLVHYHFVRSRNFSIVCSPKTSSIHPALRPCIDALKYIVKAGEVDEKDGLPLTSLGMPFRPMRPWLDFDGEVYVQPQDDKDEQINRLNINTAIATCMKHNYRLSLQSHKYLGLE